MPAEGAGIRFGQYVLLRRLARGGMAEVFLAQQHGLEGFDRRVAVKRILPHLADAPDFIKMFLSEARLAAQLTHPNIVHIYDFGKVDTDYFIAMEFVDGVHAGDLFKHASNAHDPLSPALIARIGADAAAALHYAHELRAPSGKPYGLVHRDVSPANLMVTFDGAVKLCDFGIAKAAALGEQLTIPGHVKGKYAYMSPEQTVGAPLDGRSDVYALAIVLWELIAGETIVPRGDAIEAMRAIRDGKLQPIDRVAPWTPPPLARAITAALQTRREQRPTAMQLAQELEAFIKSSPELATPMQLGGWLRGRFARAHAGEPESPGGTEAASGTFAAQAPPRRSADSADAMSLSDVLGAMPSVPGTDDAGGSLSDRLADAATMIAGDRAAFEPTDPPAALRDPSRDAGDSDPGRGAPGDDDGAPYDTADPDQNETVLRTGAFRDLTPGGPVSAPTLFAARAKPVTGAPGAHPPFARARSSAGPGTGHPPFDGRTKSPTSPPAAQTLYDPRAKSQAGGPLDAPGPRVPSALSAAPTLLDPRPAALLGASPIAGVPAMHASPIAGVPVMHGVPPGGPAMHGVPPGVAAMRASPIVGGPVRHGGPAMHASPIAGMPVMHGVPRGSPGPGAPRIPRRALAIGGLVAIAVLSFIIARSTRGAPRPLIPGTGIATPGSAAALVTGAAAPADAALAFPVDAARVRPDAPPPDASPPDAAPADAAPADAAPADAAPADAALAFPADAARLTPTIPSGAPATATLEVRTRPDGADVTIGGITRTSPAQFMLGAGHYIINAEHDGWVAEHRELDLIQNTRVVQDIVFGTRRSRPRAQTGKLSARTTPPCEVFLGTRRLTETPFSELELEPGSYTLQFKHPGHATVIRNVTITAGKTTKLSFTLP